MSEFKKIVDFEKLLESYMKTDISHSIKIDCDQAEIFIENRPFYCDRGSFIVKVFPKIVLFSVDDQDMFPRYYFLFENVISELNCWIERRKLKVISVETLHFQDT